MTDPNQPIEPEVTADAANPEAEEQVVEAEVVDEDAADAAPKAATPAGGAGGFNRPNSSDAGFACASSFSS